MLDFAKMLEDIRGQLFPAVRFPKERFTGSLTTEIPQYDPCVPALRGVNEIAAVASVNKRQQEESEFFRLVFDKLAPCEVALKKPSGVGLAFDSRKRAEEF
jgi:hypothetical protein